MMKGSVILQKENVTNNAVYILILALLLAKNLFFKAALITIDLVTMPHVTMNDVKGAARSEESTESAVCCSSTDCLSVFQLVVLALCQHGHKSIFQLQLGFALF